MVRADIEKQLADNADQLQGVWLDELGGGGWVNIPDAPHASVDGSRSVGMGGALPAGGTSMSRTVGTARIKLKMAEAVELARLHSVEQVVWALGHAATFDQGPTSTGSPDPEDLSIATASTTP